MSTIDFNDPVVDRKLTFQISRKGYAIHRDRYICFFDQNGEESASDEATKILLEIAERYYEADFLIGTSADDNKTVKVHEDDNVYLLDSLTDELRSFLNHKAAITVTEESLEVGSETLKEDIKKALTREGFLKDETTKLAYFKVNKSINIDKK